MNRREMLEQYGCAICAVQVAMADEKSPLQAASVGVSGTLQACALFGIDGLIAKLCPAHRPQFEGVCERARRDFNLREDSETCPTCRAMDNPQMTVETAHVAGIAIGMFLASGNPAQRARAEAARHLCAEHDGDLLHGMQAMADVLKAMADADALNRRTGGTQQS